MSSVAVDDTSIHQRILAVLAEILGYRPDPDTENLADLDSLQVLELLVSLEEVFDIDADEIIESRPDWWGTVSELVTTISSLLRRPAAEPSAR